MSTLDKKIKKLFMLNPLMDIKICLRTMNDLDSLNTAEKHEWVRTLNKRRQEFINVALFNDEDTCDKIIKHIKAWEKHVEPLTLADIIDIIEGTPFKLSDVAFEKLSPKTIADMLEKYLIGQHEYAEKLALSFYLHLMRNKNKDLDIPKCNLLAYGPSGAGKTFGPQVLAKIFGFKLGIINCNNLVQEGIRGIHWTDGFAEVYESSGDDVEAVEKGIYLLDEFDKLFDKGEFNDRVKDELLNIIDDNNSVTFSHGYNDNIRVSTKNMLFIFSGVFKGIEDVVSKRLGCHEVGFSKVGNHALHGDFHSHICEADFANYFNRDELTGRISQYAHVNSITEDVMANILLHAKSSPFEIFFNYFKLKNIKLHLTEDGARAIAAVAARRRLGVRGLKTTMFNILSHDMFFLDREEIVVNKELVDIKTA